MVCCLGSMEECDQHKYGEGWKGVSISGMAETNTAVTLDTSAACADFTGLAYLWLEVTANQRPA